MLMLTRRKGEAVDVYDKEGNVVLTLAVAEVLPGGTVRLGFLASKDYTILRDNAKLRGERRPDGGEATFQPQAPNGPLITYRGRRRPG